MSGDVKGSAREGRMVSVCVRSLRSPVLYLLLVAGLAGLHAACTSGGPVKSDNESPEAKLAVEFAQAVTSGNYAHAHELLSSSLRATLSPAQLKTDFTNMIGDAGGVPTTIATTMTMDSWPDKKADDLKWVYVAIAGEAYSEAVTVVVAREGGKLVIRSVEWGRP
jgi:hypothetical protein